MMKMILMENKQIEFNEIVGLKNYWIKIINLWKDKIFGSTTELENVCKKSEKWEIEWLFICTNLGNRQTYEWNNGLVIYGMDGSYDYSMVNINTIKNYCLGNL
jgi:hypothetical protein